MTCKDCIHYAACMQYTTFAGSEFARNFDQSDILCGIFEDKSRFIETPCKVGDVVYYLDDIVWDSECCDCEHYLVGGFGDPSECGRTKDGKKHPDCIEIIEHVITQRDILRYLYYAQFGKTVFLTREEAEKALKERKQK